MTDFKLVLVDPKPALCVEFVQYFAGLPNVKVVTGRFEDLPAFDCMVSAANSFGLMDGGVDSAITKFFRSISHAAGAGPHHPRISR